MTRKIAFFDIDGTLTSEVDGRVPEDAAAAIAEARRGGNLMFINTGRCFQNVEARFREIGWDGYVCGCGTNLYCGGQDVLHVSQTHSTIMRILNAARQADVDILFESRIQVAFDVSAPCITLTQCANMSPLSDTSMICRKIWKIRTSLRTSLSSGIRRKNSWQPFAGPATDGLRASTGAALFGNLSRMATPRHRAFSMCWIIMVWT